jgi:uncharacterized protein (DUF488 family)
MAVEILTIGHSNQGAGDFLALLRGQGVALLVDIRSQPFSKRLPHFTRAALEGWIAAEGLAYLWMGDVLGGRPADPALYDRATLRSAGRRGPVGGDVLYDVVAAQPWYQRGIDRLIERGAAARTAVMCAEEDPRRCHRRALVTPTLVERGVEVLHVRGTGRVESEGAIRRAEAEAAAKADPRQTRMPW